MLKSTYSRIFRTPDELCFQVFCQSGLSRPAFRKAILKEFRRRVLNGDFDEGAEDEFCQ